MVNLVRRTLPLSIESTCLIVSFLTLNLQLATNTYIHTCISKYYAVEPQVVSYDDGWGQGEGAHVN